MTDSSVFSVFTFVRRAYNWVYFFFPFTLMADQQFERIEHSLGPRAWKKSPRTRRLSLGASVTIVARDTINRIDSNLSVWQARLNRVSFAYRESVKIIEKLIVIGRAAFTSGFGNPSKYLHRFINHTIETEFSHDNRFLGFYIVVCPIGKYFLVLGQHYICRQIFQVYRLVIEQRSSREIFYLVANQRAWKICLTNVISTLNGCNNLHNLWKFMLRGRYKNNNSRITYSAFEFASFSMIRSRTRGCFYSQVLEELRRETTELRPDSLFAFISDNVSFSRKRWCMMPRVSNSNLSTRSSRADR